jgi:prevent-host-death family protein
MKTKTTLSITEARKNIYAIADEIQKAEKYYTLTEHGRPKVVMLSAEEFESLTEKSSGNGLVLSDKPRQYASSPTVFARSLIIRDESRVVYLSGSDQNQKYQEEALIKAQLYVILVEEYHYPINLVEFGRYVKVGPKESKKYIEADAIINDDKGNVRIIFEVSPLSDYEKNMDRIVADLFDLANSLSWIKKPEHLVYYSRHVKNGNVKERIMVVDYGKFNTIAAWKRAGRPGGKSIPMFAEQGV